MKPFFFFVLKTLFYPVRVIITYRRKTCFWGHKWGKWTYSSRKMIRRYTNGDKMNFVETYQYRRCERCNKYQEEIIE